MKVVHLISGGDIGGAKTHLETLLNKLNKMENIDVTLLCVIESALSEECEKMGIKVKIIPQKRRYDLSSIWAIADWINKEGFDIVHCHGARANYIAFFLRFKMNRTMVTTIHSDYKYDFKGSSYKHWVYTPLNVISLGRFKHFITISEEFKKLLVSRGFPKSQIEVIYNGIDFDKAPVITDKKEYLNTHGVAVSDETFIIGCVTRLHPVKGVDILLKAALELFKSPVNAVILIAGSGSERQNLENFVTKNGLSDRVKFLGHLKDINTFYSVIDVNVLPSISEGFGLALIEGAKYKLSTIATRTGGIPEIIIENETGRMFEVGNYQELAKLLLDEIQNPLEGKKRGEKFYEDCLAKFSDDRMAIKHIEAYSKMKGEAN